MHVKEIERRVAAVAALAQTAAILEVSANKPGNVSPEQNFSDTKYEDFLAGSIAIGGIVGIATERGFLACEEKSSLKEIKIGELIRDCAYDVRKAHSGGNTHFGMILLMIPIAAAYGYSQGKEIGKAVTKILKQTTVEDTLAFYDAIKISKVNVGGKLHGPKIPFYEMLCMSAMNDGIAEDLVSELRITQWTVNLFEKNILETGNIKDAVVQSYLELLANFPDTLIAKKIGREKSEEVSKRARDVLNVGSVTTKKGQNAIENLDAYLRDKENKLNPGTTADIVAAGIILWFMKKNFIQ